MLVHVVSVNTSHPQSYAVMDPPAKMNNRVPDNIHAVGTGSGCFQVTLSEFMYVVLSSHL